MVDLVEPETIEAYLRRKAKWVEPEFDIVEQHRLFEAADALAAKDAEIAAWRERELELLRRLEVLANDRARLKALVEEAMEAVKKLDALGKRAEDQLILRGDVLAILAKLEATMAEPETTHGNCPVCEQPLAFAPGIGPFCATKTCPVLDDSAIWPAKLTVQPTPSKRASIWEARGE
jgi:DNA repair exonuclease SbcCD ATPase subunit